MVEPFGACCRGKTRPSTNFDHLHFKIISFIHPIHLNLPKHPMTSPPLTIRQYAYIAISGPGKHEQVTQTLGLRPSEAWNSGDINPRNGKPRKFMSWHLNSGLDDKEPLELHIQSLFLYFDVKIEELRKLWVDYDITLVCVGYFPPSGHGVHFNREQLRQAAQLGLAIDLDFYYVDDYGHEV